MSLLPCLGSGTMPVCFSCPIHCLLVHPSGDMVSAWVTVLGVPVSGWVSGTASRETSPGVTAVLLWQLPCIKD